MNCSRFRHGLTLSVIVLGLVAGCDPTAEIAGTSRADQYYPLKEGASWRYQIVETKSGVERSLESQLTNQASQTVAGMDTVPQLYSEDEAEASLLFLVADETGVYSVASQSNADSSPQLKEQAYYYVTAPYALGTSWQIKSNTFLLRQPIDFVLETSIIRTGEGVSVQAGQFEDCLVTRGVAGSRLQAASEPPEQIVLEIESLNWWCSGIGLVKTSYRETSDSELLGSGSMTMELLSVSGVK